MLHHSHMLVFNKRKKKLKTDQNFIMFKVRRNCFYYHSLIYCLPFVLCLIADRPYTYSINGPVSEKQLLAAAHDRLLSPSSLIARKPRKRLSGYSSSSSSGSSPSTTAEMMEGELVSGPLRWQPLSEASDLPEKVKHAAEANFQQAQQQPRHEFFSCLWSSCCRPTSRNYRRCCCESPCCSGLFSSGSSGSASADEYLPLRSDEGGAGVAGGPGPPVLIRKASSKVPVSAMLETAQREKKVVMVFGLFSLLIFAASLSAVSFLSTQTGV